MNPEVYIGNVWIVVDLVSSSCWQVEWEILHATMHVVFVLVLRCMLSSNILLDAKLC